MQEQECHFARLDLETPHTVGEPAFIESLAGLTPYAVVFEDDGQTGFFYAWDTSRPEGSQILDALLVYNVERVQDRHTPVRLQVVWSGNGHHALLILDEWPVAVFDFEGQRGFCRSGRPRPMDTGWSTSGDHAWDDGALQPFTQP